MRKLGRSSQTKNLRSVRTEFASLMVRLGVGCHPTVKHNLVLKQDRFQGYGTGLRYRTVPHRSVVGCRSTIKYVQAIFYKWSHLWNSFLTTLYGLYLFFYTHKVVKQF